MTDHEAAPADGSGRRSRRSVDLIRDRTFGRFLAGNLSSNVGTWMHNVAAAIVVYDVSDSAFLVGMLVFTQFSPAMLLSLWAGAIADRVDRKRLLVASLALAGASGGALATWVILVGVEGLPGVWPFFVASGFIGLGHAFSVPTLHSIIPSLVPDEDLDNAVALSTVTFNLGRTLGPALAGVIIASLGPGVAFGINAASYGLFIVALTTIRISRASVDADRPGSIRAGLRFVRGDGVLVTLLVSVAALSFAKDPVATLAPAIAAGFGGDEKLVGVLVSAFGVGSVTAVALGGRVRARFDRRSVALTGFVLLGIGMVVVAVATVRWMAVVGLFVAGAGFLFAITAVMAGIYARVPDELRGRVLALWTVAFLGSRPLAGVFDGALADLTSARVAVGVSAALALVAAVALRSRWRDDRAPRLIRATDG